ncbi:hypothetical protein VQ042_21280 [Aurantimonas sp. A2-1-M11]|uniref:hypothetical protein n=1 Tax=Aurantimonas sp. A2-1-M11 TaxID=3113712 RepID=UPI002F953D34
MSKRMKLESDLQRVREERRALLEREKAVRKELRTLSQKTTQRAETLLGQAFLKLTKARGEVTPTAILHAVIMDAKVTDIDAIEVLKEGLGMEGAEPIANLTSPNEGSQNGLGGEASDVRERVAGEAASEEASRPVVETAEAWRGSSEAGGMRQPLSVSLSGSDSRRVPLSLRPMGQARTDIAPRPTAEDVGHVDGV